MTAINTSQLNNVNLILEKQEEQQVEIIRRTEVVELLGMTSTRFGGAIAGMKLKGETDVISGDVDKEINNLLSEKKQIDEILKSNINSSTNDLSDITLSNAVATAKTIGFIKYEGADTKLKSKTDTNSIISGFTADPRYEASEQFKVFESGIKVMTDWLDEYINNYSDRVTTGLKNGESEAKLSFLLRIRKAIENCDFPVGFAEREMKVTADGQFRVVGGSYSHASYSKPEFLNEENKANTNIDVEHDFRRQILLNTDISAFQRKYKTEAEAMAAVNNGESVLWTDILHSNDEVYYKYTGASLATTLIHELIHSDRINNEAITYFSCEVFEDDFNNKLLDATFSPEILALAKANNFDINSLTYSSREVSPRIQVPVDGGGFEPFQPSFGHNLTNVDSVAAHGHKENTAYPFYNAFSTGNTLADDKKELLNFVVTA